MTPAEVIEIMEAHRPKVINGMHEDDYEDILERMEALELQGVNVI